MYYARPRPVGKGLSTEEWKKINRKDKETLVRQGRSHAILVYDEKTPVGWCQYGSRDELPRIDAGRGYRKVRQPVGAEKIWRITCFFVDKQYRGQVSPRSRFVQPSNLSGIREEESSRPTLSFPRKWLLCLSGVGSAHRTCSRENASNQLLRSEQAVS